ncbi:SRPBCC family protein [Nocardia sp. NBC_00416]|uniref:SRPBCC family protein n=1 Tax=Nocardia sp. NBC_00416 TaxID=2975991 RepID=UPI002E1FA2B4
MTDDPTSIVVDQFYPHPPAKVWRALTTPTHMEKWLLAPIGFEPVVGNRFRMKAQPMPAVDFSGEIRCEVLEAVAPERLSISWNDANSAQDTGWTVSWDLRPEGRGTRILLTHSGFDPDDPGSQRSRSIMGGGWAGIAARLGEVAGTA